MGRKGRRLKRYLGLKRDPQSGHHGSIEHLLPGRISGWVFGAEEPFHEVRLLVGAHLIARAEVNQSRPDVCAQLGVDGSPGFSVTLPAELPSLDWSQTPRLLALSADGRRQADLQLVGKAATDTAQRLRQLLQSEALGLDGHCDGLVQGQLQGWAARRNQAKPAQIWLQAEAQQPIAVACDQWRDGMGAWGMPDRCGFQFNLRNLPSSWAGQRVWCSFDQGGLFRLPQDQDVVLPVLASQEQLVPAAVSYSEHLQHAPSDLQDHWQALEEFRLFLDGLEQELNRRDVIRQERNRQRPALAGLMGRLLGQKR